MTRSSPRQLADRYGVDETERAFNEAQQQGARDHVAFAEQLLQEQHGSGKRRTGGKGKALCDHCGRPFWVDDLAVEYGYALCPAGLRQTRKWRHEPWRTEPTPAARTVLAFWEGEQL